MASRTKQKPAQQKTFDTSIMNDTITSDDGSVTLHLTLDIASIQRNREQYADALMMARGLPFDMDLVQASDPVALFVAQQRPSIQQRDPNFAVRQARSYYRQHINEANRDAMVLSILVSKTNNAALSGEPAPYDEKDDEALPGILYIPEPQRNLADPVEARLRNFLQVLEDHEDLVPKFYTAFNNAMARLAQAAGGPEGDLNQVDEHGFHAQTTD